MAEESDQTVKKNEELGIWSRPEMGFVAEKATAVSSALSSSKLHSYNFGFGLWLSSLPPRIHTLSPSYLRIF